LSVETNKQLVRRLHHLWSTGDIGAIDGVYSPEFVAHFPISVDWPERRGLEGVRRSMRRIRNAFPDWHEEVKDLIAERDRVVSRYTSSGTHRGDFWGINATGRRVLVDEISIFRIVDGRVAEQWCSVDELGMLNPSPSGRGYG
jgi:predicted ester cyclase